MGGPDSKPTFGIPNPSKIPKPSGIRTLEPSSSNSLLKRDLGRLSLFTLKASLILAACNPATATEIANKDLQIQGNFNLANDAINPGDPRDNAEQIHYSYAYSPDGLPYAVFEGENNGDVTAQSYRLHIVYEGSQDSISSVKIIAPTNPIVQGDEWINNDSLRQEVFALNLANPVSRADIDNWQTDRDSVTVGSVTITDPLQHNSMTIEGENPEVETALMAILSPGNPRSNPSASETIVPSLNLMTPNANTTPSAEPTTIVESPTAPAAQFVVEGGELKEFVNGAYTPVEKLGADIQYRIGADGLPIAFYPVDDSLFHNSDGLQIAVRENGQWVINNSITLTRNQQGLEQISANTDNDIEQVWVISENVKRHDIVVYRKGDIIGMKVIGDMSKNQASVQFLMLFNEGAGNELLLVQPPEISHQEFNGENGSWSVDTEGKDTHVYINDNLSQKQVTEIVEAYQKSLKDEFSSHKISSFAFTQGVAKWIDDNAVSFGVSKEIVCHWLGVPYLYNSPTVVDMCIKMYNDPSFRISSNEVHKIMLDHVQPTQQIDPNTVWNNNLPVLTQKPQFWFFAEIQTPKK